MFITVSVRTSVLNLINNIIFPFQLELFRHLHDLPLKWHLSRKTGEVLRVMDRGTDSIDNLLSYILFSITPTIVDIIVAVVYFITAFNVWFGLIVLSTMVLYISEYHVSSFFFKWCTYSYYQWSIVSAHCVAPLSPSLGRRKFRVRGLRIVS